MIIKLDRDRLKNAIDLVVAFDEVRPGLGFLFLFCMVIRLSSRMGNLGRGALLIGPKSFGKGSLCRGTRTDRLGQDVTADDFRRKWLTNYLAAKRKKSEPVKHLQLTIEDLSPIADDKKALGHVVNLVSLLISDLEYSPKGTFDWDIDDPDAETHEFDSVACLMGTTNRLFQKLRRYHNWSSMGTDRLTRVGIIYTKQDLDRADDLIDSDSVVPTKQLQKLATPFIPNEVPQATIDINRDELRAGYSALYGQQHTRKRGRQYLNNDLKALAVICGDTTATTKHLRLWRLMAPYLEVGNLQPQSSAIVSHSSGGALVGTIARETGGAPSEIIDAAGPLQSGTPQLLTIHHRPHLGPVGAIIRHSPELKFSLESISASTLSQRQPAKAEG